MSEQFGGMFSGAATAGVVAWGLVSVGVTGPLVLERKIDIQENWPRVCRQEILKNNRPSESGNANELKMAAMACQFMPPGALRNMCMKTATDAVRAKLAQIDAAKRAALSMAISKSETRCGCSKAVVQRKLAIPAAIHSGSLRIVTPPEMGSLRAELRTALHGRECSMKS